MIVELFAKAGSAIREWFKSKQFTRSDIIAVAAILIACASPLVDWFSLRTTRAQRCQEAIVALQTAAQPPNGMQTISAWNDVPFGGQYGFDPLDAPLVRLHYATAKKLESEVPNELTFADYLVLAQFACGFAGFDDAENYVQKALRSLDREQDDASSKSVALAALGSMYFRFYPNVPAAKARSYFQQAADQLHKLPPSKKSPFIEAGIWRDWGIAELRIGFNREGCDCLKRGKQIVMSQTLPAATTDRWISNAVQQARMAITMRTQSDDSVFPGGEPAPAPIVQVPILDENFDIQMVDIPRPPQIPVLRVRAAKPVDNSDDQ